VKAIMYNNPGDSSVLELRDRDVRDPEPGEVRVRVAVSGVNPTDWKSRASAPVETTKVPNQDGAGVVDAVGEDVTDFAVGDRVWLWDVAYQTTEGTAQQFVTLPAGNVVTLPAGESFDTGASLGIPALTAHLALTSNSEGPARLAPGALDGTVVLVTGGAGAVSHAAIQLAVWAGATVATTVSGDEKAELASRAGAHHIINYRTEDVVEALRAIAPNGVDTIVDVNIAQNMDTNTQVIGANGTVASYTDDGGGQVTLSARSLMGRNVRVQFLLTYTASDEAKQNAVAGVSAALADGALRVGDEHGLPLTRFALADTAAAHDAVEGSIVGKVLIDVDA
jgi:NADPH2:quinone reductase